MDNIIFVTIAWIQCNENVNKRGRTGLKR